MSMRLVLGKVSGSLVVGTGLLLLGCKSKRRHTLGRTVFVDFGKAVLAPVLVEEGVFGCGGFRFCGPGGRRGFLGG
jgi:hypothetical protein